MTTQAPNGKPLLLHSVDLSHRFYEDASLRRDDNQAVYRCTRCGLLAVKIRATGFLRRSEPSGVCSDAIRPPGCTCLGTCQCGKTSPPAPEVISESRMNLRILESRCVGTPSAEAALRWFRSERERNLATIARYECELLAWERATGRSTP